jgi:titin
MIALDFTIGDIVEGNYIGTDALGSTSLPGGEGVYLSAGASGNIVGGTAPGAGNVISCSSFADPSSDPFQTGGADEVVIYGNYYSPPGAANIVEGNFIGTDATGTKGIANDGAGVLIAADASGNVIGGTSPGSRNIISGNAGNGVEIDGTAIGTQNADANFVEGNYIGTDVTGLKALGNLNGVVIDDGASNNIIGGTEAGARNIISGNTGNGVEIDGTASGPQTSGNVVEGNYIGTDVTGLVAVGNLNGIVIDDGATDNTIGGATAGSRNVISGNSIGIRIEGTPSGPQTSENFVEGNYIGTDSSSLVAVGNGDGILITNAKHI